MNDSASHFRKPDPSPSSGETESVRADGQGILPTGHRAGRPIVEQPTIITSSLPLPSPANADSAGRILDGRVMPGDRLGHFELVEYVGGGGMGRVFRAVDTQLGRTVALKILPPEQAAGADAAQRFQNEAQSAARLDHENIARVYFVGEDRNLSFIVFEFVEGVNVRMLVEQKGPLPLAEAISYTIQVTEALAHADARGVVHRDIKPSNVLITPEGRVKLIDMGLARLRNSDPATADLTQSGVTLGTFDYISPEQARDPRNADIRSDIYSLGCTLFFMLTGQPPFPEGTVLQKLLQHQGDQAPDIRQFREDLSEGLSRVLRKMMAKDPRNRYAESAELATDLLALADQIGLRPMSPTSRVWLTPPDVSLPFFRRHLPWMAPVAALLCVVLFLEFSARRDDQSQPPPLLDAVRADKTPAKTALPDVAPTDISQATVLPTREAKEDSPEKDLTRKDVAVAELPEKSSPTTMDRIELPPIFSPSPFSEFRIPSLKSFPTDKMAKTSEHDVADAPEQSALTPPKRSGVLIVSDNASGDNASGDNEFSSLASACTAARNGDVIELRFNGPREERPMKLSNLQVTVQAGKGYRPVIVFRPTTITPFMYQRSMCTLAAGRLTMIDVAIELQVPREIPADNWTLLETWGGQTLRLERCSLTVRNASDQLTTYHQEVAFIRARPAPDADVTVEDSSAATPLATIELTDCVARGEAVFLCVEDLQPISLLWKNGLLATTEQLLTASGGQVAPKLDESLRVELRHVTATVQGGLCRLNATPANPYQLAVQFVCADDIILTSPGSPLIEQVGTAGVEKSFVWNGNRNYYQDVNVFWMLRNIDSQIAPEVMTFENWKTHWGPSRENQASRSSLSWRRLPSTDQPLHAHTAADYSLEDAPAGAPGLRADRLPRLPSESIRDQSSQTEASILGHAMKDRRHNG